MHRHLAMSGSAATGIGWVGVMSGCPDVGRPAGPAGMIRTLRTAAYEHNAARPGRVGSQTITQQRAPLLLVLDELAKPYNDNLATIGK